MRRLPIALVPLCLFAAAAPALAGPGFDIGARGIYWFPDLDAKVRTQQPGFAGTEFDAKDDLGVGDENFPAGEVFVRIGRVHLRAGYASLSFDGNKQITRSITFDNVTFGASDNVISSLDAKTIDGEIQVDLLRPNVGVAGANFGLLLKVKYVDGEVKLRSAAQGTHSRDFSAPVPMVGAAAGVGFLKDTIRVDARAAGMAYSGHHLYEGDAYASFAPLPLVRLQGGYRLIDLKIDETDDIMARLKLRGPYAGIQVAF